MPGVCLLSANLHKIITKAVLLIVFVLIFIKISLVYVTRSFIRRVCFFTLVPPALVKVTVDNSVSKSMEYLSSG